MNAQAVLAMLQSRLPELLAVYALGSRTQGAAGPHSDLDTARAGLLDDIRERGSVHGTMTC